MRIITRRRLREFGEQHPDAITPLDDWYRIVRRAEFVTHLFTHEDYDEWIKGRR
jgi:mRNA-degrading endonuclease HigB of HigAB toxin-antitoxin module